MRPRLKLFALQSLLTVEPLCYVYASLSVGLWFPGRLLWVAKYHAFAVALSTTLGLLAVLRNVKQLLLLRRCLPSTRQLWPAQLPLHTSHTLYGWRVIFSAAVHSLVHATSTHPFRLPRHEETSTVRLPITVADLLVPQPQPTTLERIRLVLVTLVRDDLYTLTGYCLLILLAVPFALVAVRLRVYRRGHAYTLLAHQILALAYAALIALHTYAYHWPILWLTLFLVDQLIARACFTENACRIERVARYPNRQLEHQRQTNDVICLTIAYPSRRLERLLPGDYVRIRMLGGVGHRFEWHDFTLVQQPEGGDSIQLIVRCVGRWTHRLYRLAAERLPLSVRGPYSLAVNDTVTERLLRTAYTARFTANEETARPAVAVERNPKRLILVCSGTAITHHMSLLDILVPLYYHGFRERELPSRIVLCWTVRTVFNLNFALAKLASYQQRLYDAWLGNVLLYEFFVTEQPDSSETLTANHFRRMLLKAGGCGGGDTDRSPIARNSRISMCYDDRLPRNTKRFELGSRIDFQAFAERHVTDETLVQVFTSVAAIHREFGRIGERYKCKVISTRLY